MMLARGGRRRRADQHVCAAIYALGAEQVGCGRQEQVILHGHSAGKIGNERVRVFDVEPAEHRLCMRFVLLRRSEEIRMSLKEDEERQFLCRTNGIGWPTLREASPEDVAEIRETSTGEPSKPADPTSPNQRRTPVG
jgi:hypothetical protein